MARKLNAQAETKEKPGRLNTWLFIASAVTAVVVAAFIGIYAFSRLESALIRDPHYTIPPAKDYGEGSDNIRIYGMKHAPRERVSQVFARDIGRSLYVFPTAERRRNLLAIDWVKEANVQRVWPNEVHVHLTERTPIAFVPAGNGADGAQRYALIDDEGVLLPPNDKAAFTVPVLLGLGPELDATGRRDRLRRVMRLLTEVGPMAEKLAEIDVTQPDALKVTMEAGSRVVTLILGDERYLIRLKNFLNNQEMILQHAADAKVLDMRLEDRVISTQ